MNDARTVGPSSNAYLSWVICAGLALVSFFVFWPVHSFEFVRFDDPLYILENKFVRGGLTGPDIAWAFRAVESGNWHPLTWLSHMLDCELFGINPGGHHVTNVLFHTANAVLLFFVLRRMTGAIWRSAAVAALFALHPLHVESVAWVSERKDVLSAFFWFLTFWFYTRYVEELKVENAKRKSFYVLALGCFALGLMSKPMTVTLPFTLLLLDFWPLKRVTGKDLPRIKSLLWEKIPFFALTAVFCGITIFAQQKEGAVTTQEQMPLAWRAGNALISYGRYIRKMFWPDDLTFLYPHPGKWPMEMVVGSALFLAVISVVVIWIRRRCPYALTGWLFYLGTLVPVIGLVQAGVQSMADRFTYVPMIGLFIALVWGYGDVLEKLRLPRTAAVIGALAILAACVLVTVRQLNSWKDSAALYHRSLEMSARDQHYIRAMQIAPFYMNLHLGLCTDLAEEGHPDRAANYLKEVVQIIPQRAEVRLALGIALAMQSKWDEAASELTEATRLNPNDNQPHFQLGKVFAAQGKFSQAMEQLSIAIKLKPDEADTHFNLALVLERLGRRAEAAAQYRETLRCQPDFAEAQEYLKRLVP